MNSTGKEGAKKRSDENRRDKIVVINHLKTVPVEFIWSICNII
jgi:hypothetical protein